MACTIDRTPYCVRASSGLRLCRSCGIVPFDEKHYTLRCKSVSVNALAHVRGLPDKPDMAQHVLMLARAEIERDKDLRHRPITSWDVSLAVEGALRVGGLPPCWWLLPKESLLPSLMRLLRNIVLQTPDRASHSVVAPQQVHWDEHTPRLARRAHWDEDAFQPTPHPHTTLEQTKRALKERLEALSARIIKIREQRKRTREPAEQQTNYDAPSAAVQWLEEQFNTPHARAAAKRGKVDVIKGPEYDMEHAWRTYDLSPLHDAAELWFANNKRIVKLNGVV